jgi:hypothetical protein
MYGIDGNIYAQGTADFIVSQTDALIQGFNTAGGFFNGISPEKVAVALPACASAAGGGYTDTATVRSALKYLLGEGPQPGAYALAQPGGYPSLRGMMTWSVNWDAVSACNGANSYAENYERIFGDINTAVSVQEAAGLRIGPNPVQDQLMLLTQPGRPAAFLIRDMSGRTVVEGSVDASRGMINVQAIMTGAYILTVRQGDVRRSLRFVKD